MLKITFILLAAGNSTRFGSDKLIAEIADKKTILQTTAEKILTLSHDIVAVTGPNHRYRTEILKQLNITTKACEQAHAGMGYSLTEGIKASASSDGWIICLADMPFIKVETLNEIYQQMLMGTLITAPYYQGRRGHPVGISKHFFSDLIGLDEDKGAQSIIKKHQHFVIKVPTDDAGILTDIDTTEDMANSKNSYHKPK